MISIILYLQLIMQMQSILTNAAGSPDVLQKPEHILLFVKHVLASTEKSHSPGKLARNPQTTTLNMQDLRIVEEDHNDLSDDADSDDEIPETHGILGEAEMTETAAAVNLLLAVLEGDLYTLCVCGRCLLRSLQPMKTFQHEQRQCSMKFSAC